METWQNFEILNYRSYIIKTDNGSMKDIRRIQRKYRTWLRLASYIDRFHRATWA